MATTVQKPMRLTFEVTHEQGVLLVEAAERTHQPLERFVCRAALEAAASIPKPRYTAEEGEEILKRLQAEFRESNAYGRDLVQELLDERREEALREG